MGIAQCGHIVGVGGDTGAAGVPSGGAVAVCVPFLACPVRRAAGAAGVGWSESPKR
jgi:hypothetical protein